MKNVSNQLLDTMKHLERFIVDTIAISPDMPDYGPDVEKYVAAAAKIIVDMRKELFNETLTIEDAIEEADDAHDSGML